MKCFHCEKELNLEERYAYKTIAMDRPYANLLVHPSCLLEIESVGLEEYLKANFERILNYVRKDIKK